VSSEVVKEIALNAWFEPKVIVPAVCVILASVLIPILLHYLKGKREREDRILEIRTKVYSEYFKKFEDAASGVGNDYEEFSQVTLKEQFKKLLDSDNSNDALIEFQDAVNEFPMKIQTAHRKATQESTTLKVLGSPKLFALTNEFEEAHQEILELSAEWLTEMKQAFTMPDFESPIAIQMKSKGKNIGFLQKEIIKQMRVELKLE
jgi:hypothetical protein